MKNKLISYRQACLFLLAFYLETNRSIGADGLQKARCFSRYFPGDLTNDDAVLDWLIKQRTEDTIENINRDMLNRMIEETDYLAVFFCKQASL